MPEEKMMDLMRAEVDASSLSEAQKKRIKNMLRTAHAEGYRQCKSDLGYQGGTVEISG